MSQSSGYFRSETSLRRRWSVDHLQVMARYQRVPSPGRGVRLGRLVILDAICWPSPAIFNASFRVVAVAGLFAGGPSYFSIVRSTGVMSGVRVHDVGLELLVVEDLDELVLVTVG